MSGGQTTSTLETWISLNLNGSPAPSGLIEEASIGIMTESGAVSLATTVRATQDALGLPLTASNGVSLAWADAGVALSVTALNQERVGGTWVMGTPLVGFHSSHGTTAGLSAAEPLFARASTLSQGLLDGLVVQASDAVGLDVVWNLSQLELMAMPIGALAMMTNRVDLYQVSTMGATHIGELGFSIWLEGETVTLQFVDQFETISFEAPVGEQLVLPPGPLTAISMSLPVASEPMALRIINTHAEMSVAAVPRASIPVLAAAGSLYRPTRTANQDSPRMYWDPKSGQLELDPIPISWSEGVLTASAEDPLFNGGQLEITGLQGLGQLNGLHYFSDGTLSLRDRFGTPLLSVSLPAVVFEDSLFAFHGLNGFAPILQMPEVQAQGSEWLDGFVDLMGPTTPYLPELFLGFDHLALGEDPWSRAFEAPVSGFLSFIGAAPPLALGARHVTVPIPGSLSLLTSGIALLVIFCCIHKRQQNPIRITR